MNRAPVCTGAATTPSAQRRHSGGSSGLCDCHRGAHGGDHTASTFDAESLSSSTSHQHLQITASAETAAITPPNAVFGAPHDSSAETSVSAQEQQAARPCRGDLEEQIPLDSSLTRGLGNKACVICFDDLGDHVMVPCGHGGYCHSCSKKMCSGSAPPFSHKHGHMCPLCMTPVDAVVKVFLDTPKDHASSAECVVKCVVTPIRAWKAPRR